MADEVAAGMPEPAARFTLSMFRATRSGHFAHVDSTLTQLLGREPRSARALRAEQIGR